MRTASKPDLAYLMDCLLHGRITQEYFDAARDRADRWVPACGGAEKPMLDRAGRKVLYCYNHATGEHRYIDLTNDMALAADYDPKEA